ncbi:MAG: hypothetical protein ACRESK_07060 [Gammaproteobacteria bacterium]
MGTMDYIQLVAILLSWTVNLSGYPKPETLPLIEFKPHDFFVEHACLGNTKCRVAAWYDNKGVIYIDDKLENKDDVYIDSLIVHELVHYLQDVSKKFNNGDCQDYLVREREAYGIQRQYLNRIAGRFVAIYMNFPPCPGS